MAQVKNVKKAQQKLTITMSDGIDRVLFYDLNAFAVLETKFGSIQVGMEQLQNGSIAGIKTLLWIGFIHDHVKEFDEETGEPISYTITPYDVGKWITPAMMPDMTSQITQAMGMGMPDPKNMTKEMKEAMKAAGITEEQLIGVPEGGVATVTLTPEEEAEVKEQAVKN